MKEELARVVAKMASIAYWTHFDMKGKPCVYDAPEERCRTRCEHYKFCSMEQLAEGITKRIEALPTGYNQTMKVNLAEIGLSDNNLYISCSADVYNCPECDLEGEILSFDLKVKTSKGKESQTDGPAICWCSCGCVWNPKSGEHWNTAEEVTS